MLYYRPGDRVANREEFVLWCCRLHNEVNEKLHKEGYPCDLVALDKRWRNGGKECDVNLEEED